MSMMNITIVLNKKSDSHPLREMAVTWITFEN